jgi:mRNA interferase MazF
MKKPAYVPDRGDIVWLLFNPQSRHEQARHRPAHVLSPFGWNCFTSHIVSPCSLDLF